VSKPTHTLLVQYPKNTLLQCSGVLLKMSKLHKKLVSPFNILSNWKPQEWVLYLRQLNSRKLASGNTDHAKVGSKRSNPMIPSDCGISGSAQDFTYLHFPAQSSAINTQWLPTGWQHRSTTQRTYVTQTNCVFHEIATRGTNLNPVRIHQRGNKRKQWVKQFSGGKTDWKGWTRSTMSDNSDNWPSL